MINVFYSVEWGSELEYSVSFQEFSVSFQGPTYYNSLENDIKQSYSLNSFKTKLKKNIYVNY